MIVLEMLLSFILPGLGQFVQAAKSNDIYVQNERCKAGGVFLGIDIVFWIISPFFCFILIANLLLRVIAMCDAAKGGG